MCAKWCMGFWRGGGVRVLHCWAGRRRATGWRGVGGVRPLRLLPTGGWHGRRPRQGGELVHGVLVRRRRAVACADWCIGFWRGGGVRVLHCRAGRRRGDGLAPRPRATPRLVLSAGGWRGLWRRARQGGELVHRVLMR